LLDLASHSQIRPFASSSRLSLSRRPRLAPPLTLIPPLCNQWYLDNPRKLAEHKRRFTRYPSNQPIDDEQTYVLFPFSSSLFSLPFPRPCLPFAFPTCSDRLLIPCDGNKIKKLETSPRNRYYGLPVEHAPPHTTNTRRAAGARDRAGPGEKGWTSRRGYSKDPEEMKSRLGSGAREEGAAVVGGQMGRFQLTSRTGLGGRDEVSFHVGVSVLGLGGV
jgi:hypothetical protein